jgi:hypothetical protein
MKWQTGNETLWQLPISVMARTYAKWSGVVGKGGKLLWQHRGVYRTPCYHYHYQLKGRERGNAEGST